MRIDLYEDIVTPDGFREATERLEDGEALELHIDSCGGDVLAGIAMANRIRELINSGHAVTCTVDGLAASIASVIAMACDEIRMYPQSFLMIHNPWTFTMGDADGLRKEAQNLDAMKAAIVSFYRQKFNRTDEEIRKMMDDETWISGENAGDFGLSVTLIEADSFRAAARVSLNEAKERFNAFSKVRKDSMESDIEKKKEEEKKESEEVKPETEETTEEVREETKTEEEKTEEEKTEETEAEEKPEEESEEVKALKARIAELEEEVKRLHEEQEKPIEERLAKCQSVFQCKINDLKREQQERDGKLHEYENRVSTLETELATSKGELTKVQAALTEKTDALAKLNASVLAPSSAKVYDKASARAELAKLPMNERADFYSKHKDTIG